MANKPRVNMYTCRKCGADELTRDRDKGTTPFQIPCLKGCGGTMVSAGYRVHPVKLAGRRIRFEWYKPGPEAVGPELFTPAKLRSQGYTPEQVQLLADPVTLERVIEGTKEHVEKGGLLLRRIART